MPRTKDLLAAHPWRTLRAIARALRWDFDSGWTQPEAALQLAERLTQTGVLRHILNRLPPDALEALLMLRAAGGAIVAHHFLERFGPLRPYRPWRRDSPRAPWDAPASPAETLWYRGLIFEDRTPAGRVMLLADELQAVLPKTPPPEYLSILPAQPRAPDLILDLAHLLAFLQSHDARLLHGRWLPPRTYRALNAALASPDAGALDARSELRTGRLRFLHYLAEVAGLAAPACGLLRPTPLVAAWLDCDERGRHQALLDAWHADLRSPAAAWSRYRFPGTPRSAGIILALLAELPEPAYDVSTIALELEGRYLAAGLLPEIDSTGDLLHALLHGPLAWTGWLTLDAEDQGVLGRANMPGPHSEAPAPLTAPAQIAGVEADAIALALPPPPARPPLQPLVNLGLRLPEGQAAPTRRRTLSRSRVATLLSCGVSRAWICQALSDLTCGRLPQPVVDRLAVWEAESRAIALRQAALLSVAEPAMLVDLTQRRAIRPLLRDTLSPHHVVVSPGDVVRLVRVLDRLGHTPLLGPEVRAELAGPAECAGSGDLITLDAGAAGHLWLALRIVLDLADVVALPGIPPAGLLDSLGASLGPALAALEDLAQRVAEGVRDSVDGYTPFPAPLPDQNLAALLDTLNAALAGAQPLELVYHTAGRGERTTRVVEPLRMEERGGAAYLVAYCRLRQEERVFRVDRIERASPVAGQSGSTP